jgi:hypothetical protein
MVFESIGSIIRKGAFEILALAKREKVFRRLESVVSSAFSCSVLIRVCLLIPFVSSLDHVYHAAFLLFKGVLLRAS